MGDVSDKMKGVNVFCLFLIRIYVIFFVLMEALKWGIWKLKITVINEYK